LVLEAISDSNSTAPSSAFGESKSSFWTNLAYIQINRQQNEEIKN
jgi:hypothetical protein